MQLAVVRSQGACVLKACALGSPPWESLWRDRAVARLLAGDGMGCCGGSSVSSMTWYSAPIVVVFQ